MKQAVLIVLGAAAFIISAQGRDCCSLHQLSPKTHVLDSQRIKAEFKAPSDDWFELNHTDNWPEYYLGSGAAEDTFFIVFNPVAPCSVKSVEAQWFDSGTIHAFAAIYTDTASALYPFGQAPPRGTSLVYPIGSLIGGPVVTSIQGTQDWEDLGLPESGFVAGDPVSFEISPFGIGFEKQGTSPHPMADRTDTKGIHYTYTWFTGYG